MTNEEKILKATVRTLNKLMKKSRTAISKAVRSEYTIKAKDLKRATYIQKANRYKMVAAIIVKGHRIPLMYFSAKQNKKGVSVRIKKSTGRKTIRSAFIAVMNSGHVGVFQRVGKDRTPIDEKYSIDAATMVEKAGQKTFEQIIKRDYSKVFDHELSYLLSK